MEEKYMKSKKIIMITMCCLICVMAIGYAAFATNLTINGTANITSTWKVLFTKIEEVSKTSGVTIIKVPTAEGTNATFNVDLKSPGDKIAYKITVANQGTLDAIINDITASETGSDAIKFEITGIKKGDKLAKSATTTFNVTISYDSNVISQPNVTDNTLTMSINYVQDVNQTVKSEDLTVETTKLSAVILKDNNAQPDTNIDFSQISSDTNGKGLYYTNKNTEDGKTTYYFRGAVENNYVAFGETDEGMCTYKNAQIIILDSDGNQIYNSNKEGSTTTKSLCQSTNVCEVHHNDELIGAMIGINEEACLSENSNADFVNKGLMAVWTNEKATFAYKLMQWQIVRINEDGSIRIIKQDSIGKSYFNSNNRDASDVGYMYGTVGSTTYEVVHANINSSTIKTVLDNWYKTNLINYSSSIADAGFCGDRGIWSGEIGIYTIYRAYERLGENKSPQFGCSQNNDLYTTSTSTKGNKALTYPIGLITADEAAYAGGVDTTVNETYYLVRGENFWTITPGNTRSFGSSVWYISSNGMLGGYNDVVNYNIGVYPVINLKSTVEITSGDGTIDNPYVIKTN